MFNKIICFDGSLHDPIDRDPFMPQLRRLTERANNDPQRMRARKTEAEILARMPPRAWLSCTAVSRLIGVPDDRRIRARLDYLVRDGKLERKRDRGVHGPVYLFRIFRVESSSVQY